jgi:hypothetical protein
MVAEAKKHGICEVVEKTASGEHLLQTIEKHLVSRTSASASLECPSVESLDQDEPPKPT